MSDRQEEEGKKLLKIVKNSRKELNQIIEDEEGIEIKMSTYGRKVMDLESNLKKLQLNLRKDIENTKDENARYLHEVDKRYLRILEILHTKSMGLIQRVYRGFAARRVMSYYYLGRTTRVWDVESGRGTLDLIFIAYFSVFYGYIYMYTSGGIFLNGYQYVFLFYFYIFMYLL